MVTIPTINRVLAKCPKWVRWTFIVLRVVLALPFVVLYLIGIALIWVGILGILGWQAANEAASAAFG